MSNPKLTMITAAVVASALLPSLCAAQPKYKESTEPVKPRSGTTQNTPATTPAPSPTPTPPPAASSAPPPATAPRLSPPSSCASGSLVTHNNGLGQSYASCSQRGTPGNAGSYNVEMAMYAANAWGPAVAIQQITCSSMPAVRKQTQSSCAVWVYGGPAAGHVLLSNFLNSCSCPRGSDPVWN